MLPSPVVTLGAAVHLRPVAREDLGFTCRWRNDPQIRRLTLARAEPTTPELELAWFRSIPSGEHPGDLYRIIESVDSGQPVGLTMFRDIDWTDGVASFGIWIAGDQQGRGFGEAGTSEMVALGGSLGLSVIRLRVLDDHGRAIGLYERIGFRTVAMESDESPSTRQRVDIRIMELDPTRT